MDDAAQFVRDAMSFAGWPVRSSSTLDRIEAVAHRVQRLLHRRLRPDEPNDPFSYVGAPIKPKTPRLKSAVRLPLP